MLGLKIAEHLSDHNLIRYTKGHNTIELELGLKSRHYAKNLFSMCASIYTRNLQA